MTDHTQYSDMLPLLAVGALSAAEESELQTHLRSCPDCRNELTQLRGAAALLAMSAVGPAPPQRARQRLLATISNEPRRQAEARRVVVGTLRPRWLSFAPIAAALLLAIFSLMMWQANSRLLRRLDEARASLQDVQSQLQKDEELASFLRSPDNVHVVLVNAKTPPVPHVNAIYSAKQGRLLLLANNLPVLPEKRVYELWLLPANGGKPMPCGLFTPDAKGDATMVHPLTEAGIEAKGFAITVEPESGSDEPTSDIQMAGAV